MSRRPGFPFSALVGQETMRLALVLSVVRPQIGGVLLRGEKGTAKSTAVRALARLLGDTAPLRTLPLGATEDRLAGGLDLTGSLQAGRAVFAPGLLAAVDGGVLYVDEVNLLDDHLVDLVLDAAASGVNRVEREGLSLAHPTRFSLVGTMNPEEGALRPQLLDRFGLCVDVTGERDISTRVELLRRCMAYDSDPQSFVDRWRPEQESLSRRLLRAREVVSGVQVGGAVAETIAELCRSAGTAGHRADLVLAEASRAHAAWQGRVEASVADVLAVAELALVHRRRDAVPAPPRTPGSDSSDPGEDPMPEDAASPDPSQSEEPSENRPGQDGNEPGRDEDAHPDRGDDHSGLVGPDGGAVQADDDPAEGCGPVDGRLPAPVPGDPFRVRPLEPDADRQARRGSGRRHRSRSADRRGRYVRSRPAADTDDLALDATLRAAAVHQRSRRTQASREGGGTCELPAVIVRPGDWQAKVRERRTGSCVLFVVDASGSMGARGRMVASKGAVLSLLLDAYQKRDKVAMVAFRRRAAEVLLPPTASIEMANRLLEELPVGGRTPLSAGLCAAAEVLAPLLRREPLLRPLVVLISDGRANAAVDLPDVQACAQAVELARRLGEDPRVTWVVVDTEDPKALRLGLAKELAAALHAPCYSIDDLHADDLVGLVKGHTT
ncbi:magnesium chelatase subunit D family protein [Austwickia chelonae]|uniref:magnesium chelatase subunit D family protein n=1 Tax=Austwickia chelonae TaxID=100225 RepID=UPI000E288B19|nr:magnesium chelatase subunit D family protein [Austwickia chelonae]